MVEPLDLSYCVFSHPLVFDRTTFEYPPDLSHARFPALTFTACSLTGLMMEGIRLDGLSIRASQASGFVWLEDAVLGGKLDCSGTTLECEYGPPLYAVGAEIASDVLLRDGFSATGGVSFRRAKIGGNLDCSGATLSKESGVALNADFAEIAGGVGLSEGFHATGQVRLMGAKIGGPLACFGATLVNEGDAALVADQVEVAGMVFLRDGFAATGEVRLVHAKLGSQLDCSRGTFDNEGGIALGADSAEITGAVYLRDGFSARGWVRFVGAKLGVALTCSRATFSNDGSNALSADYAEIAGDMFLGEGFSAIGKLRLPAIRIGGALDCSGVTIHAGGGNTAIDADGARIAGDLSFSRGSNVTGAVLLRAASIGGHLECVDSMITDVDGFALVARDASIGNALVLRNTDVIGGVDLFRASATTLVDDLGKSDLGSWDGARPLILDGFAYARFGDQTSSDPRCRRDWLKRTDGFQRGAWQQLLEVYAARGQHGDANRVAIAMENDRVERGNLTWYAAAGRRILGLTVGYGYRPWLAGIWAIGIVAVFALVVWHWSGMFAPAKQGASGSPQPVAYATDTFLPIVDLGQAGQWSPTGWLRWIDWSVILLGWALTTIFVAGFTRIVRTE